MSARAHRVMRSVHLLLFGNKRLFDLACNDRSARDFPRADHGGDDG